MGPTSNQQSQRIQTRGWSIGRSFSSVDPERQREIDLEHASALATLARRVPSSPPRGGRAAPSGWFPVQYDPSDEGGSVRRGR